MEAIDKLPPGSVLMHSLVMKTNVSNKYYDIYTHTESPNSFVVYVHHGRIGDAGRYLKHFTAKTSNDCIFHADMQANSKKGKGYVPSSGIAGASQPHGQPKASKVSLEKKVKPQVVVPDDDLINRLSLIE